MTIKLTYPSFKNSMSAYLKEDFKKDEFQINSLEIEDDNTSFIAYVNMISCVKDSTGLFHLSALTNSRIIQQIGIIFSCHLINSEKDREIFFLRDAWKYKRVITKQENIKYHYENIILRSGKNHMIGRCQVNVEDGAFFGESTWLIPNNPYEISK